LSVQYRWVQAWLPVTLDNRHNHQTLNANALSFRKPDDAEQSKFEQYFAQYFADRMTAAAAADFHASKQELNFEADASEPTVHRADAAVNPK